MSQAQQNFERAVAAGRHTLDVLSRGGDLPLSELETTYLQTIAWDLEAIQAAVRLEILGRGDDRMDTA